MVLRRRMWNLCGSGWQSPAHGFGKGNCRILRQALRHDHGQDVVAQDIRTRPQQDIFRINSGGRSRARSGTVGVGAGDGVGGALVTVGGEDGGNALELCMLAV
jgi:hypothetical protein